VLRHFTVERSGKHMPVNHEAMGKTTPGSLSSYAT